MLLLAANSRPGPAPGPRGHWLLGNSKEYSRDPLAFLLDLRRQYGDVARVRFIGNLCLTIVSHPDDVEQVLQKQHSRFRKGAFHQKFGMLTGNGLLLSDGVFWKRQRRLEQPAFSRERLARMADAMVEEADRLSAEWPALVEAGQPVEMIEEMMALALRILGRALFGADLTGKIEDLRRDLTIALQDIDHRISSPVSTPLWMGTAKNRRVREALARLDEFVYGLMRRRREEGGHPPDVVSMLLEARDRATGEGMTDRQVRDEVMTLLLAGHETSGIALTWTWYALSQHPEMEQRLHQDLESVLGGRLPAMEDLPRLPYLRMIVDETLRLYPPAWGILRQAAEDVEVGGCRIPRGAQIVLCAYATHRHPDFWQDPEQFDPERFSPDRSAGRHHFAYYPFGGGPRICIGNNLALMEMQLVLAVLCQRYRARLVPGHPIRPQPAITLRPRHGMKMLIETRKG